MTFSSVMSIYFDISIALSVCIFGINLIGAVALSVILSKTLLSVIGIFLFEEISNASAAGCLAWSSCF